MSSGIRRRPTHPLHEKSTSSTASSSTKGTILPTHISRKGIAGYDSAVAVFLPLALCVGLVIVIIYWVHLKETATKLNIYADMKDEEKHVFSPVSSSHLLRVSATDHANITQFFPCVNDVFMPKSKLKSDIERILQPHRKKSRSPSFTSLPCAPPSKICFCGVYDIFDDFLDEAHKNYKADGLLNNIAALIETLILHPGTSLTPEAQFGEPTLLEHSTLRQKNYTDVDGADARNYGQLHGDYFESNRYVYTAILYDAPPENFIGGETAIVDLTKDIANKKISFGMNLSGNATLQTHHEASGPSDHTDNNEQQIIDFNSGVIVEPKRGRLVLFSAGGENFHTPMEVKRGVRPTYHFWFKCKSGLKGTTPSAKDQLNLPIYV